MSKGACEPMTYELLKDCEPTVSSNTGCQPSQPTDNSSIAVQELVPDGARFLGTGFVSEICESIG